VAFCPVAAALMAVAVLATSTSLAERGQSPAFVLGRAFADGAGVAARVRSR
jgi:hypothetical protein